MSLVTTKLAALAVLFFTSLLLGLLPFPLRPWLREGSGRGRGTRLALSCLQCLGGGVLLATVMTHMLPEIREGLEAAGRSGGSFPLAEVLLCAGMFSIYAVEELAMLLSPAATAEGESDDVGSAGSPILQQQQTPEKATPNGDVETPRTNYGTVPAAGPTADPAPAPAAASGHGHSHMAVLTSPSGGGRLASFRVLIVTAALSFHSVFEGVAIGLEASETSVWLLTAAIATHKSIIAFCLGEQLAATQRRLRAAIGSLFVFVSASPLGVAVGLLVIAAGSGDDASSRAFTTDVLQALAAGTILYVVLFEIIQGERAKPGGGMLKLAAILAGFGIMLLVNMLIQEPDEKPVVPTTAGVVVGVGGVTPA